MFDKVLVANRGEIAVRVMRTLREMGIGTVAVYSEADRNALHVRYADEAWCVGPAASRDSYLRTDKILDVAAKSGATAIHPGYGFLSENAAFAEACGDAGVTFIGPPASAIVAMGEKTQARRLMIAAGVPVVPGAENAIPTAEEALEYAETVGFPVLIKAAAGGGGKGMRRVDDPAEFVSAFAGAQREAQNAFGDGSCYVEKFIVRPKHVEFQVLADTHGNTIHLFERECSVQRRHQKIIEETPCPVLLPETRAKMGEVAVRAAEAVDYVGAGTIEFLLDAEQNFYFLEMNTRLQVEHPITEMVTGVDLVEWQLRIADGEELTIRQEDLSQQGHAVECRIYAEDAAKNFMPSPGRITHLAIPDGPGVRNDGGVYEGAEVPMHYDPMVSKLVVHASSRERAIARMERALEEYVVHGIETNIAFLSRCLQEEEFLSGAYDTGFVARVLDAEEAGSEAALTSDDAVIAAALAAHGRRSATSAEGIAQSSDGGEQVDKWKLYGRFRQLRRI